MMHGAGVVKMIIFLKERVGLLSRHERNAGEVRQGCGLHLRVFKTEESG